MPSQRGRSQPCLQEAFSSHSGNVRHLGYTRVSSSSQDAQLQLDALAAAGVCRVDRLGLKTATTLSSGRPSSSVRNNQRLCELKAIAVHELDGMCSDQNCQGLRKLNNFVLEKADIGVDTVHIPFDKTKARGPPFLPVLQTGLRQHRSAGAYRSCCPHSPAA